MWVWIILGVLVIFLAYVRLAPVDVGAVHQSPIPAQDGAGSALQVVPDSEGMLARLDAAMMAEPATKRIAGSVADGRISYVSRSRWIGFPDYTTLQKDAGQITLFARLRFGQSDLGVNRKRLQRVIAVAQAGG